MKRDILRNRRQDPIPRSGAAWSARGETPTDPPSPVTATSPTAMAAAPLPVSAEAVSAVGAAESTALARPVGQKAGRLRGEAIAADDAAAAHYRLRAAQFHASGMTRTGARMLNLACDAVQLINGGEMATRKASCNCGQLSVTYEGPDPQRVSLCQCYECQKRTGTVLSMQTRLPLEHVTIEGQSKTWTFPIEGGEPATFRSCDSGGATYHFCPECGSTVYWDIAIAPEFLGMGVGSFADPTFPPPMISGFEAYGPAWTMNVSDLPMPGGHHDYDGTSHGGARL